MRRMSLIGLLLGVFLVPPAQAGDDDDPFGLDEEDDEIPAPKDDGDEDEDLPELKPQKSPEADVNFEEDEFEEDAEFGARKEGEDDAKIYREFVEKMKGKDPDAELLEWERYLKKYPNSLFRSRIQDRMSELEASMFDTRLGESSEGGLLDAGKAELRFAQPFLLESIDPRTKLRVAFELGFPEYLAGTLDYEHQILRNLSVHGGLRSRYSGLNLEAGVRYAPIKSARTKTLVTGILDLHANTLPFFFGVRPQIGIGQRFDVMSGLDVQGQFGVDLPFGYGDRFSPRYIGGLNVSLAPSDILRVYAETSTTIKDPFYDGTENAFRYNLATIGLKFIVRKGMTTDRAEIGAAASLPYATSYWGYHYGAIGADAMIYLQ